MELDGTPVQQPDDPFKGDASVTAEQPVQTEQPAQTEQVVQEEPVTAEAQPQPQPQPQPASEAAVAEKPKWIKIVDLVAIICISAAGLLAALFMCLMSVSYADTNIMLRDVAKNITEAADLIEVAGGELEGMGVAVTEMFSNAYVLLGMVTGIVAGIVLGIILIVKIIKKFALKKPTALEKTAITSCLFFFAISVMVLGLANSYSKVASVVVATEYGGATLAGLILCGILFAAYFICKIVANYKSYLGDKTKLINGCLNLGWAIVAMIVLAVLSCVPVLVNGTFDYGMGMSFKMSTGAGFNNIFSSAIGEMVNYGKEIPEEVAESLSTQYSWGAIGMVIQIWFIFQTGKSLHGAMRGTIAADKAVKLGSQIWRTVFAVLYLIACVVLAQDLIDNDFEGGKAVLAAPIVILVFSIVGLVIAIVNKILVKEKTEKHEI